MKGLKEMNSLGVQARGGSLSKGGQQMRRLALFTLLVFALLIWVAPAAQAAGSTYIGQLTSNANPTYFRTTQSTVFTTSFKVLGDGRNNFAPTNWALAYAVGKRSYTITYKITIREAVSFWFDNEIVSPQTYTRTATIVSGAGMPAPFWVQIKLEDGRTVVPKTIAEAQSLMFDVQKSYNIIGSKLGAGTHKLFAKIEANWSGYMFSGSDKKDQDSPRVTVTVTK
jgi:hypothetical protein